MSNIKELIEQVREQEIERNACLEDEKRDARHKFDLSYVMRMMPAWKKWWLKKNQPGNYFRLTCIVPPGTEELNFHWVCKFQIWSGKRNEIIEELHITVEAYQFVSGLKGWQESDRHPGFFEYRR